jgi:TetR/AcrR family transcriptional regulator, regulator of cefoperazone and chloramphenicol sensitivity
VTQDELLGVAIREFGLKGLDGASTRGIAGAAGTAMSSITYHYGSKEALYLAAADHIAAMMAAEMAPAIALCDPPEDCDADSARAGLHAIMDRLADKMASETSADASLFIMREQLRPSEAFTRIYQGAMGPTLLHVAALIRVATGCSEPRSKTIALTLFGQVLAIRSVRAAILHCFDIPQLDGPHTDVIREQIHSNIDAILDRMTVQEQK